MSELIGVMEGFCKGDRNKTGCVSTLMKLEKGQIVGYFNIFLLFSLCALVSRKARSTTYALY